MPLSRVDIDERRWIELATAKEAGEEPDRVRHVVPDRYEAYAKILHPLYELPDVEDRDLTWDDWERAAQQGTQREASDPSSQFEQVIQEKATTWMGSPESMDGARPVSWRDLTERYGLGYVPEISHWSFKRAFERSWPRYLTGAREGNLDPRPAWALLECLQMPKEQPCRFWFSWADSWAPDGEETGGIAEGTLVDLARAMVDRIASWPTEIWAIDESWFVGSDPDLDCTLVGGPRSLADAILSDSRLETFEVTATTGIGRDADGVNR